MILPTQDILWFYSNFCFSFPQSNPDGKQPCVHPKLLGETVLAPQSQGLCLAPGSCYPSLKSSVLQAADWGKLCSSSPFPPQDPWGAPWHTDGAGGMELSSTTEIALSPTRRIKQGQNTWASFIWLDNQTCRACGGMVHNKVRFGPCEIQNTGSVLPLCALS